MAAITGPVPFRIDPELVAEVFGVETRTCFLDDHRKSTVIQQERRARGSICITRHPFIRPDVVELDSQECMQEILRIELILHTERGSILPPESQLPSDGVKPTTECLHKIDRARSGSEETEVLDPDARMPRPTWRDSAATAEGMGSDSCIWGAGLAEGIACMMGSGS